MSIRWDELCMYCPLYSYCSDTLGETCEYPNNDWEQMRTELIQDMILLDEEVE